jgi:hypothetical protein
MDSLANSAARGALLYPLRSHHPLRSNHPLLQLLRLRLPQLLPHQGRMLLNFTDVQFTEWWN